ncbi:MAG: hypothetical protein JWQ39_625 [Glaciihabitans sp.]|nr:hypothetical protein [Glaciihabitans sp.]
MRASRAETCEQPVNSTSKSQVKITQLRPAGGGAPHDLPPMILVIGAAHGETHRLELVYHARHGRLRRAKGSRESAHVRAVSHDAQRLQLQGGQAGCFAHFENALTDRGGQSDDRCTHVES